jgi:ribosomal protein S18 acetylase RimI-like enzyme
VFVAQLPHSQAPLGYIAGYLESGTGHIGLLAVDPASARLGFGGRLVKHALQWMTRQGATRASVVTQGCNIPAQRLYQRRGFHTAAVQLHFHKWYRI